MTGMHRDDENDTAILLKKQMGRVHSDDLVVKAWEGIQSVHAMLGRVGAHHLLVKPYGSAQQMILRCTLSSNMQIVGLENTGKVR
jgi:hypothetical protein